MYTVTRTASSSVAPAAAHTALRFSRHWTACSAGVCPTSSPESGSSGIWPEQNRSPAAETAWLYGPMAAGAPTAVTGWRWCDMDEDATLSSCMRARRLLLPGLSCVAFLAPAPARAETLAFSPCASRAGFECGTLNVPLDRTGATPGTIALAVTRAPASSNPQRKALLTLAGGPGQAAVPLAEDFASAMGAGLDDR